MLCTLPGCPSEIQFPDTYWFHELLLLLPQRAWGKRRRNNSYFPSSPPTVWDEAHIWTQGKLPLGQNYRMNEEAKLIAYIIYQKAELYDLASLASQRLASAPPCYSPFLLNPFSSSPPSNTRLINTQPLPNWQWFRISSAIPWPSEWDSTEGHTAKLLNGGFSEVLIPAG